jgi:outer membrane lipoprotein SlyB
MVCVILPTSEFIMEVFMKQEPVGNRFFCYLLTACGLLLFLDGCSRDISSASYDEASVGETRDAYPCIVEHVRRVKVGINMKEARLGMLGGAAVGGGLGHLIGQGRGGKGFATVGGGILGGVVGSALEKGLTDQDGLEYRVRLL